MSRRAIVVALAACVSLSAACSAGSTPSASQTPDLRVARSQAAFELLATRDDGPGCTAAVGERGVPIWQSVRGLADVEGKVAIAPDTAFELASLSKQFTALSILLLQDAGKLSTDDTVSTYLDGLPAWGDKVTLAQMMHHTSGIAEYFPVPQVGGDPTAKVGRAAILRRITAARRLDFPPGSTWRYSNSNYVLLAEVIEQVSGQSYQDFLETHVFKPLGLSMVADDGGPASGQARPYQTAGLAFESGEWRFYAMGATGVRATAGDMIRWADDYRTGTVGGPALLVDQWKDAVDTGIESTRYGAGMFRFPDGTVRNNGEFGGYRSSFAVSPDRERSVAVLCNQARAKSDILLESLTFIWGFH